MNEPSWRKPTGVLLILLLIAVWAVLVVSGSTLIEGTPWPVQALYYGIAGIAWIAPLRPLLIWMETGRWK